MLPALQHLQRVAPLLGAWYLPDLPGGLELGGASWRREEAPADVPGQRCLGSYQELGASEPRHLHVLARDRGRYYLLEPWGSGGEEWLEEVLAALEVEPQACVVRLGEGHALVDGALLGQPEQVDWVGVRNRLGELAAEVPAEVPRRDWASLGREAFAQEFARPSHPVLLDGALEGWPREEWTLPALARRMGAAPLRLRVGDYEGRAFRAARQELQAPFEVYVRSLLGEVQLKISGLDEDGLPPYAGNVALPEPLAELVAPPPLFPAEAYDHPRLWLGPGGTVTPLHADVPDNVLVQLQGSKLLRLIPPWFAHALETERINPRVVKSHVDPVSSLPAGVPMLEVTVAAGEALFVPGGWFHHVTSCETSLSVNFFVRYQAPLAVA